MLFRSIDESVQNDANKFYTYADFQNNLYGTVSDFIDYPGIVDLMEGRSAYLSAYPGFQGTPDIENVSVFPEAPVSNDMLVITAQASNASEVILFYRTRPDIVFEELLMNDEGIDGDTLAGDGIFSSQFLFQGRDVDYYIYAENDSAGAFSPQRAAYEYFTIEGQLNPGDIVINELMASNVDVVADADGAYDDWIELLNTTANELSLGGLYLSDDATNLSKWALPNQELSSGSYFIIWADSEDAQGSSHANFKLSSAGESLFLSDAHQVLIDSVLFPEQIENVSYGRMPNGLGDFTFLSPTFEQTNDGANLIPLDDALVFNLYPNPVLDVLYFEIESQSNSTIQIIDVLGRVVFKSDLSAGIITGELPVSDLNAGLYVVSVRSNDTVMSKKMVKR